MAASSFSPPRTDEARWWTRQLDWFAAVDHARRLGRDRAGHEDAPGFDVVAGAFSRWSETPADELGVESAPQGLRVGAGPGRRLRRGRRLDDGGSLDLGRDSATVGLATGAAAFLVAAFFTVFLAAFFAVVAFLAAVVAGLLFLPLAGSLSFPGTRPSFLICFWTSLWTIVRRSLVFLRLRSRSSSTRRLASLVWISRS